MKFGSCWLALLIASLWLTASTGVAQDRPLESPPEKNLTEKILAEKNLAEKSAPATSTGAAGPGEATPAAGTGAAPETLPAGSSGDAWLPRFRRIFFYESHAPRLIPGNFWPVSLDDLESALRRESTPGQPGEERPQLSSAVYVARFVADSLVSDPDASLLDLTYRDDAPGQLSLGPMNLAVEGESATAGAPAQSPRLLTTADGGVRAVVYQDSRLRFGWSRRGLLGPDGSYTFDLRIPPCGRTRFVVGMPEGMRLESLDGVITAYPSPPQEARGVTGETELTWYGIEAGGLTRLRLVVRSDGVAEAPRRLSVRQVGLDYAAAPDGLGWTARLVVDVPRGQTLPQLTIFDGGRITSVRVNDEEVRWKETADNPETAEQFEGHRTRLQVISPPPSASLPTLPVQFEITGIASLWDSSVRLQGTIRLPQVGFPDRQPRLALSQTEAFLRVRPPLRLVEFVDLDGWTIDEASESAAANPNDSQSEVADDASAGDEATLPEQIFRITGPPSSTLPTVRFAATENWPKTNAALRLVVFPSELLARWEAAIQTEGEGPQPLQFEFQPDWQIDRVSLLSSGRIIEVPSEAGDSRPLTVWPEAGDVVEGVLRIQITGRRVALPQGELETVPATWFARLRGGVVRCVAAVVPPSDFDWVSGTALRGRRIKTDELSAAFAEMIGPVSGKTLLFDTDNGLTPELQVRQPPPVFSADLHLDLQLEENEVVEQLRVACRLPAGRLPQLRVRLGAAGNRPPMQWSLANPESDGAASQEPFRAAQVEGEPGDDEIWELTPPGEARDEWVFIGRRHYPLPADDEPAARSGEEDRADTRPTTSGPGTKGQMPTERPGGPTRGKPGSGQIIIPLPTVPLTQAAQTSSQRATVSIGPRLSLLRTEGSVLRVPQPAVKPALGPHSPPSTHSISEASSAPASGATSRSQSTAAAEGWLLRYDASNESSVVLRAARSAPAPSVVWDERVEVLAGIGGGDRIRAAYRLDGPHPLELRFDPEMRVTEINGQPPEKSATARPGEVRLVPRETGGWVHIDLWRPPPISRLMRKFRAPVIETSAVVLRRSWRLWSAPDTLVLAASSEGSPPSWMDDEAAAVVTPLAPGQTVWLARSGFAWALGGALALFVLGISWWLFRIAPWVVVAPFIGVALAAPLLPVWTTALVGFVLLPMTAAGLLASVWGGQELQAPSSESAHRSGRTSQGPSRGGPAKRGQPPSSGSRTAAPVELQPTASIGRGSSRLGVIWLLAAVGAATVAQAADPEPNSTIEQSFPVMIPVTADGKLAGDRVYIPKTAYDSLFRPTGGQQDLGEIQFQSATYQVRVTPSADTRVPDSVVIEATWRVEIETASRLVRLPIDPMTLDRLEVIVDSVPNEIRPRPDGNSVLIRPPRAGLNILRASLSPEVEVTAAGGVCRFEMGVPAVARASLTVSSDGPLTGVSLPNCFGRIEGADSGNRLTASLGPIRDFVLLWQHRGGVLPRGTDEVQRRWWVQASGEHVSRELEIEIGDVASSGAIIELSGGGSSEPIVTSPDWMLQESDDAEPAGERLRLVSLVESPGPIRLLWSEPQTLSGGGTIELPDVRPEGLPGGLDTLLAIDVPDGWSVAPSAANELDPTLEPAEFFELWQGFQGPADRVLQSSQAAGMAVQVLPPAPRSVRASESHRLVVAGDHLRVSYFATVHTVGEPTQPVRLLLPPEMRLESLQINGEPTAAIVVPPTEQVLELLLPRTMAAEPTELQVVGTVPVDADKNFAPPRVRLSGVEIEDSRYQMFRGDRLRVRELAAPTEIADPGAPIDYDLTAGTVPLQSWILAAGESPRATRLAGRYQITDVSSRFAATTLTTLRWEDGRWTMEATIDVDNFGGSTDFLTVEVPTRWIEGLDVEPAAKWSSQPAIDPATQLIRILPQSTSIGRFGAPSAGPGGGGSDIRVRITSSLENAGEGGISVPSIRLLGEGPRQRFFAPPRRLTNTQIDWQTRNARWSAPPTSLQDVAPPPASHLFYEIAGESFSATLRQADSNADAARCPLLDVALFPRGDDSLLALMRWDLLPGNRDQVDFQIPPGAQVLGTWASGTPTEARPDPTGQRVTVPVGLSRLAQQIVLLVSVPVAEDEAELALPHLVEIPVERTWVASYDDALDLHTVSDPRGPSDDPSQASEGGDGGRENSLDTLLQAERLLTAPDLSEGPWRIADADAYRRALAAAMMDALDASVDNVAERPTAEKRQWLRPWFARLQELGWPGIQPTPTPLESSGPKADGPNGSGPSEDGPKPDAAKPDAAKPDATKPDAAKPDAVKPDERKSNGREADGANSDAREASETAAAEEGEPAPESVWSAIDAWAPRFLQRVLGGEFDSEVAAEADSSSSWWIPPPTWTPSRLISAPGGGKTIPAAMAPQQVVHGDPAIRAIRVLWLGMLAWMIASICLRLIGARYLMHPALWLAIFGLLSLSLIPLPLSLAMCGVAVASPLLRRRP